MESLEAPGQTLRAVLDYICWISKEMRQLGYHSGSERDEWCRRVHRAYAALFVPMVPGHGDPYPPDVPPARNPGIWPDVPSAAIPGMTLRHQLTVMEMLAFQLRALRWTHARAEEVRAWDKRLVAAWKALDHGEGMPLPEEARTEPCQEALDEAVATAKALKDRARKRGLQLRRQFAAARKERTAAKKKAAKRVAKKAETPPQPATKKKAAKKATTKKPAAAKAAKKKAAPKKAAKKKTAAKKAAKKPATKRAPKK